MSKRCKWPVITQPNSRAECVLSPGHGGPHDGGFVHDLPLDLGPIKARVREADAGLMAYCHTDIHALVAEVERLRAQLADVLRPSSTSNALDRGAR